MDLEVLGFVCKSVMQIRSSRQAVQTVVDRSHRVVCLNMYQLYESLPVMNPCPLMIYLISRLAILIDSPAVFYYSFLSTRGSVNKSEQRNLTDRKFNVLLGISLEHKNRGLYSNSINAGIALPRRRRSSTS